MNIFQVFRRIFNDPYTRTTRRVAKRLPQYERPPEFFTERTSGEWAEDSCSELDDAAYVQRVEEDERVRRLRTSRKYEGMGREYKEIPDPWLDSYK